MNHEMKHSVIHTHIHTHTHTHTHTENWKRSDWGNDKGPMMRNIGFLRQNTKSKRSEVHGNFLRM